MLQKLIIKNYALIDHVEMDFSGKMNIITGETGAGKSIILGGLSLMLGQRAETRVLFNPNEKCVVEGRFQIEGYQLDQFFADNELDYDPQTIVRREITPAGKSRAFINDTPVTLPILKELTEKLVSLHAQHQTLHLYDANFHLFIIDTLANHETLLSQYKKQFQTYQKTKRQRDELQQQLEQAQKDMDYVQFQLNELDEANLSDPNEQEQLEKELKQLEHADSIKRQLSESIFLLEESEPALLQQLRTIRSQVADSARYMSELNHLAERIESVSIELADISNELSNVENDIMPDPQRMEEVNERLNLIYRLQKKHRLSSIAELIQLHESLANRNQSVDTLQKNIDRLEQQIVQLQQQLIQQAQNISANRQKQFPVLEQKVGEQLAQVGMPNARLQVEHQSLAVENLNSDGIDVVQLLFAPNKGSQFYELRRVASGGELSRLMLCIQTLLAAKVALPTLIFDEIDTGISGEVALKVGRLLQKLGNDHQIICITHLPQMASRGDSHFFVYKDDSAERSISRIRPLSHSERVKEIAVMLSSNPPTTAAIENAKILLTQ